MKNAKKIQKWRLKRWINEAMKKIIQNATELPKGLKGGKNSEVSQKKLVINSKSLKKVKEKNRRYKRVLINSEGFKNS